MSGAEAPAVDELLRELTPQVVAALARRYGDFAACEDATQEALLAASVQWPRDGRPDNPRSWLITAASRRRIEALRSEDARRRREEALAVRPEPVDVPDVEDTLTLLMLCCHPALTPVSQVALTLRAVGGLTTSEIARAFLVPESTIGQRISRAKQRIKASGAQFTMPPAAEQHARLAAVLHVLYLVFNEGYTATSGPSLVRVELSTEAIRLARQLHDRRPDDGEVAGLLALMLLTDARRPARLRADGTLVPLAEQDRGSWNQDAVTEGVALISGALRTSPLGPYQLQAAIAAVHDEAPRAQDTDWSEILGLYDLLLRVSPGPMVSLNRIVALAMVDGPRAGLAQLSARQAELAGHHRVDAVRAHLLERAGDLDAAREQYVVAARHSGSIPEQHYLEAKAASLAASTPRRGDPASP